MTEEANPVRLVTLISLAHGAALEIMTGMQMSRHGNCIKGARIQGVLPATGRFTKKQALEATIAEIKKIRPDYVPAGSVAKALAK